MTFNTMYYLGYVNKDESIIKPQPRAPFAPQPKAKLRLLSRSSMLVCLVLSSFFQT